MTNKIVCDGCDRLIHESPNNSIFIDCTSHVDYCRECKPWNFRTGEDPSQDPSWDPAPAGTFTEDMVGSKMSFRSGPRPLWYRAWRLLTFRPVSKYPPRPGYYYVTRRTEGRSVRVER